MNRKSFARVAVTLRAWACKAQLTNLRQLHVDIANIIQNIAIYALPVIFAITVHEAAHGYSARYFGDNTAWMMGRVTLNPLKHIDPFGTILLPLMLVLLSSPFIFGAAKPVPVRFDRLRNPKRDMVWVALAGPAANLAQALAWGVLLYVLQGVSVTEPFFLRMCQGGVLVNVVMFAFNLFPLPPLDGGRILVGLLPTQQALLVSRIEPYGFFVVMALVIAGIVSSLWMQPVMALTYGLLELLLSPLAALVH
jgi:Zn-dependent protease